MATRFCPECGAQLLEGARFCSKCRHEIKQAPQPRTHQVEMSGYCAKCGAPLIKGAVFCSKCRAPVGGQSAPEPEPAPQPQPTVTPQNIAANAQSYAQTAAQRLGRLAPSNVGEFSFDLPTPASAVTQTAGKRFGILNILAGLGAGGISGAALWNAEKPMLISACVAVGVVVVRVAVGLVRRGSR